METISMEMVAPAAPQPGPSQSSPEKMRDSSFGKTLAKVQQKTGSKAEVERSHSPRKQGAKNVKQTLHEGDRGEANRHDPKVHEKKPDDQASATTSGPMAAAEIQKRGISPSENAVLSEAPTPEPSEMPAEEAVCEKKAEVPSAAVAAEKFSLPVLPEVKTTPKVNEPMTPESKAAPETEAVPNTAEVHKVSAGTEPLPASSVDSRETGRREAPHFDVAQFAGNDSKEQSSASLNLVDRGQETGEVTELSKFVLRMPEHPSGKPETGKKVLTGKRESASAQRLEALLTEKEFPTGMPTLPDEEIPLNGRKFLHTDEWGSSWFREGFAGTPPQSSFSSDGLLPTEGLGRGSESAAPAFGKEQGQGLLDQVQSQLHLMAVRGRGKMVLHLHPEYLGKLRINVSLQQNHLVAEMTTDSAMTREILSSHVHSLKEALLNQGIRLERFDIHLQDNTTDGGSRQAGLAFQEQARQQQQGRTYPGAFPSEDARTVPGIEEAALGAVVRTVSRPGINLFV